MHGKSRVRLMVVLSVENNKYTIIPVLMLDICVYIGNFLSFCFDRQIALFSPFNTISLQ
jgi:hypothetical protein